jgi:inorganic triphosphatase YgiF
MSAPREIELKLEVPANRIARLTRSSLLSGGSAAPRKPATLVSVYFDTKKQKLRDKGLSLRVRRIGPRRVQTLKEDAGDNAALFARHEWEQEIESDQPQLDALQHTTLAPLLGKKLRRRLLPLFETRIQRTVYPIRSGESEIELTIDKGKIEAGRKSSPLCEVELELKRGEIDDLFEAARKLAKEVPFQLAVSSKAERGYSLIAGKKPEAVKAVPVVLTPEFTCADAFRSIARSCLRQLVANQPAMLRADVEGLHQMRVALRRLRAAISLFSDMLVDRQTQQMKSRFQWIGGELGPAREFDVFIRRVLMPVAQHNPNGPGVAVLTEDLEAQRKEAFERACAAVQSERFRDLMLDIAAWIETGDWSRNTDARAKALRETSITALAADELNRRRKQVLKKGGRLKQLDIHRRHKLRIQAKKLRYAAEFFAGAFPGKKAKERREDFVSALELLQDALGDLNDISVHEGLTERIADAPKSNGKGRKGRAKKAFAAGRLAGREEARVASVLKDAQHAYRIFADAKPHWA